jgi:hypothetical protein
LLIAALFANNKPAAISIMQVSLAFKRTAPPPTM